MKTTSEIVDKQRLEDCWEKGKKRFSKAQLLDQKEAALVAIGAAIAAGCKPCTSHLVEKAKTQGITNEEIYTVISQAANLRNRATELMKEHGFKQSGKKIKYYVLAWI